MQEPDARILRGAAIPAATVGVVLIAVFAVLWGWHGFLGALFGVAVTVAFFGASLLVTSRASKHGPTVLMGAAFVTYLVKLGLLGVLLVTLHDTTRFNFQAFAISILVTMIAWLAGQVRAFAKTKMLYVEPGTSPGKPTVRPTGGP